MSQERTGMAVWSCSNRGNCPEKNVSFLAQPI